MAEITLQAAPATAPMSRRTGVWRPTRMVVAGAVTVAVAAAVLVVGSTAGGPEGHGPTAFAVERLPNNLTSITIVNSDVSAHQMTDQLHAQGLDITIRTIPTTPDETGHWVVESFSGDVPQSVSDAVRAQTIKQPRAIEVPSTFRGSITFGVAVPSRG
jgi:hypothetical protein